MEVYVDPHARTRTAVAASRVRTGSGCQDRDVLDGLPPARRRFVARRSYVLALVAVAGAGCHRVGDPRRGGPAGVAGDAGAGAAGARVRRRHGRPRACWPTPCVPQGREVTVVDLPGDGTGDLDASRPRCSWRRPRSWPSTGRAPVGRRGRLLGRRRRRPAVGARPRRRQRSPAASSPSAPPTTAPTWPASAGDVAPDACPEACRQLPAGQRPAAQAQRRRRDARRSALGLDLDHRRPHRGPAVVVASSRAPWASPSSRSAREPSSATASCRRTRS